MNLVNTQTTHKMNINQKEKINCVQMYLGVTWFSKICTTDGASFLPGVLEGNECQLNYKTTLTTPHQVKPGPPSWKLWRQILKPRTTVPTSRTTTNRLQQKLGMWKSTHSESGRWLSYQDSNKKFYARETHDNKVWKICKRTNGKTQLSCVDTTTEYQPTKYSIPVQINTTAGGKIYNELGAELVATTVDENVTIRPAELFEQLLAKQPRWISDLTKFVTFAADESKYNSMDITIDDVLRAHNSHGCLVAVSDGSVRHTHQMSFGWVLATADGKHLAQSCGGCNGRGSSL